jgi:hypothetical protein
MPETKYHLILEVPRVNHYRSGRTFDYPTDLPLPRIGEEIRWVDYGLDKTYYLKVTNIIHIINLEGFSDIKIITKLMDD